MAGASEFGERLLALADRDPDEVIRIMTGTEGDRPVSASRALGISLRMVGRVAEALTVFDEAVDAARADGDTRSEALTRLSRSSVLFMSGRMDDGVADLDHALAYLVGPDRGVAVFQRAQYLDVVDDPAALATFDEAVALLTGVAGYDKYLGHALANRGIHHSTHGRLALADADLAAAHAIWTAAGLEALASTALHNIGHVAASRGDYVSAIDHFEQARLFDSLGTDHASSGRDYCEVLIAAGLTADGEQRAAEFAAAAGTLGNRLDAAELHLTAAHAAYTSGALDRARHHARLAVDGLTTLGRRALELQARLVLVEIAADSADSEIPAAETGAEMRELADALDRIGQDDAALGARLRLVQSSVARGEVDVARATLAALAPAIERARLARALQAANVDALCAAAAGDRSGLRRAVRRGVELVETGLRATGAIDMRAHLPSHAATLFQLGKRDAWQSSRSRRAFTRMEQLRGLSLRYPAVRPPDDERMSALLNELRAVSAELAAESDPSGIERLENAERVLRRHVADHVRRTPGTGGAEPAVDVDVVVEQLGGRTMLAFHEVDNQLVGFRVGSSVRRFDVGPVTEITDRVESVRLALRRVSRQTSTERSRRAGVEHVLSSAEWLNGSLLGAVHDDEPLVIVVPPTLAGAPWGLMPKLADRSFVLAPSVSAWARATRRPLVDGPSLLVAGPDLPHASASLGRLAAATTEPTMLDEGDATAAAVTAGLAAATVTHLAAHFRVRAGNPLFSSLRLADGPLFVHDLALLRSVPSTWVIPACESSADEATTTDDLVGLSATLLSLGARSLVLAAGLVPDDEATTTLMETTHRRLTAGDEPSSALATGRAELGDDDSPSAVVLRAILAVHGA